MSTSVHQSHNPVSSLLHTLAVDYSGTTVIRLDSSAINKVFNKISAKLNLPKEYTMSLQIERELCINISEIFLVVATNHQGIFKSETEASQIIEIIRKDAAAADRAREYVKGIFNHLLATILVDPVHFPKLVRVVSNDYAANEKKAMDMLGLFLTASEVSLKRKLEERKDLSEQITPVIPSKKVCFTVIS